MDPRALVVYSDTVMRTTAARRRRSLDQERPLHGEGRRHRRHGRGHRRAQRRQRPDRAQDHRDQAVTDGEEERTPRRPLRSARPLRPRLDDHGPRPRHLVPQTDAGHPLPDRDDARPRRQPRKGARGHRSEGEVGPAGGPDEEVLEAAAGVEPAIEVLQTGLAPKRWTVMMWLGVGVARFCLAIWR